MHFQQPTSFFAAEVIVDNILEWQLNAMAIQLLNNRLTLRLIAGNDHLFFRIDESEVNSVVLFNGLLYLLSWGQETVASPFLLRFGSADIPLLR